MDEIAIRVEGLGKRFRLRHQNGGPRYRTLREELLSAPRQLLARLRQKRSTQEEFWALQDVSFEVKRGEVLGIIGRNGAGKSTLLKVLSRIMDPSTGEATVYGRIGSLLEVGTGFHPELTGRENIYLSGALLGMKRDEVRRRFDEIVEFAGVEKFLDTACKHYSSGMYTRLGFAVAAHLDTEILLVDEVLAVGDVEFQQKCLAKMNAVAKGGRTVLFVSHNMSAVLQLTSAALVLDKGLVAFRGATSRAVAVYSDAASPGSTTHYDVEHASRRYAGSNAARFLSLSFDRPDALFRFGEDFHFRVRICALEDVGQLRISMTILTQEGTPVGSCFSADGDGLRASEVADIVVTLPNLRLAPGRYSCGVAIGKGNNRTGHVDYDVVCDVLAFEVTPETGAAGTVAAWPRGWGSVVFPELIHQTQLVKQEVAQ